MWIFQQNANSKQRSVCLMENVLRESNQLTSPITESVFSFPCFKRKCTNFFLTVGKWNILLIRSEARCKGLNVRRNRSSSAFSSVKRFTSAYATAPPTPPPPLPPPKFELCLQLFRERLLEKMCTRQSRKVIWDMIKTVPDTVAVEPTFVAFLSEPTIWLWIWVISASKKNLLKDDFEGKKILERKYQGKKYLSWLKILEKNLTPLYVGEKEIISPQVWGRKIITQTKSPIPPPTPLKSQMVGT